MPSTSAKLGLALLAIAPTPAIVAEEAIPISDVAHIHGVGFDPQNPDRVLLATHYGIYAALADGTAAFHSTTADDFMGFSTVPGRNDLLVASGHPGHGGNLGFVASTDGGITWVKVSDGVGGPVDFHALTVSPADPQVMYGTYGGIQRTEDGGKTWVIVSQGPDALVDLAAAAGNPDEVFAATGSGLFHSADAGATWQQFGPQAPVTMVETGPDGTLFAMYAGVGLFNGTGSNWTQLKGDLAGRELLHIAIDPRDPRHLIGVTHASEVLESLDGGNEWTAFGR